MLYHCEYEMNKKNNKNVMNLVKYHNYYITLLVICRKIGRTLLY